MIDTKQETAQPTTPAQTTAFLTNFMFSDGLLQVSIGTVENMQYFGVAPTLGSMGGKQIACFFAPALRRTDKSSYKDNVIGTKALWVDVDVANDPQYTFKPSAIVWSGHGYHLYWFLREPLVELDAIEALNQILEADIPGSDACWNANRILRVPGTWNVKPGKEPVLTHIIETSDAVYDVQDFVVLGRLSTDTRELIGGATDGRFKSRSERDWAVTRRLVIAGATDTLITTIFKTMPIGDKVRERKTSRTYLQTTIDKVRDDLLTNPPPEAEGAAVPLDLDTDVLRLAGGGGNRANGNNGAGGGGGDKPGAGAGGAGGRRGARGGPMEIVEKEDGYYLNGNTSRRISTFILDPKILLDGSHFESEDAIVCDVTAAGYKWEDVTFPREAFTSVSKLDRHTPLAAWQWLGHDGDVRLLLPYLLDKLRKKGLPKIVATPTLGLHMIKDRYVFLGDKQALDADNLWHGSTGPLTWLPIAREHPKLQLTLGITESELDLIGATLPALNAPSPIWTMIGWFGASPLKPWFESKGFRFPILNVTGTKGSGKTTLVQRIFLPLLGHAEPKAYDAGTTRFVTLALLGSSNAVPISFSEFRYESVEKFIRTILMAYDTGHDPRGRADQTTQDYPLSAPFSVDGEDMITDSAAQERIVVAKLDPQTIDEGGEAYRAFQLLRHSIPPGFGGYYVQTCLIAVQEGRADAQLRAAQLDMQTLIPSKLPDRIRNNYTVVMVGIRLICDALGIESPPVHVLLPSITELVNLSSGRSKTQCDEFAESVVNATFGNPGFRWEYDPEANAVFFQLGAAHSWWMMSRRRQGRGALERDAIRTQLKEAPYGLPLAVFHGIPMVGVSLEKAVEVGLDVPHFMHVNELRLNYHGRG